MHDRSLHDQAPDAFWRDMRPRLELYLRSFSGLSEEDREDVLQRVMLAYVGRSAALAGDARPWLYRVARNAAIDLGRSRRREERWGRRVALGTGEECAEPESPYQGPEDGVLAAEGEAFVARFLSSLAESDRELLHLAYAEGLSYPQIAAATERPLGTIKWRLMTLRRRLEVAYRKEYS